MTDPVVNDPAPNVAPPSPAPAVNPAPRAEKDVGFSPEYVKDLREENKGWRLKATEQEQARKTAEDAAAKAKADADAAIKAEQERLAAERQEWQARAKAKIIHAETKAAAVKAGMIDLDGLKLADMSALKINDAGEVEGADALIASLKESKPYLFGSPTPGTSNPSPTPKPAAPNAKAAFNLSPEEWAAKLRDIDSGRKVVR